jgi:tricorn protease
LGETRQLTKDGTGYRYQPAWSPDSKWLTYSDKTGALFLYSLESSETKQIDRDPSSSPISVQWSPDNRWIVWSRSEDLRTPNSVLWVYQVENGTKQKLTSGFFSDSSPVFDRKGEYIYFSSNRSFTAPKYDDVGTSFVYTDTEVLVAMPLRADVKNPMLAKSDEEEWQDDKKKDDKQDGEKENDDADKKEVDKDADEKSSKADGDKAAGNGNSGEQESGKDGDKKEKDGVKPFEIDFAGIEARSFQVPVKAGSFGRIAINDKGNLIYLRIGEQRGDDPAGSIQLLDLSADKVEEKKVVEGVRGFAISVEGKKLMVMRGENEVFVVDAAAEQKLENPVPMTGMTVSIDPRVEWKQVFNESWRVERDFFYDPNMHGVDWPKIRDHYGALLEDCVSRRDVSFLIKEMIAELNVGHAYYGEGDVDQADSVGVGLLGCRFQFADAGYKMVEFWQGAAWDVDARNPLVQAGVKEGQYLLAVNGVPFSKDENPYKAFVGKAGMSVTLTVSDKNVIDDEAKHVVVKLLASDNELRFRHWIEAKRRQVEEKSDGKIGYIYVVNTGIPGQNDLVRMLSGQLNKEALIIDDRWNGGGQIPTRFIELLNRPATNAWARRDGRDWVWPPDSHLGPKCMLINGMAGSGGDMFPALFKQNKLGPLIGMRTWGGLVGISGGPTNIDGSNVTAPTFAYYDLDGTWGIEGHGVDPDIKVIDDPAKMLDGGDPQLAVAIDEMLKAIKENGFMAPKRPPYPDRSKMGIKPEDK